MHLGILKGPEGPTLTLSHTQREHGNLPSKHVKQAGLSL